MNGIVEQNIGLRPHFSHLKYTKHYKKAKVIVMIDETQEEENKQKLAFGNFLNNTRKVDNLTIFSRNNLHER
ncbi:MAG: hypothetical protein WC856_27485 [Methylococcaceae bacterium]